MSTRPRSVVFPRQVSAAELARIGRLMDLLAPREFRDTQRQIAYQVVNDVVLGRYVHPQTYDELQAMLYRLVEHFVLGLR